MNRDNPPADTTPNEGSERLTLPFGFGEFEEGEHGWLEGRAHGLTSTRVPTLVFDEYVGVVKLRSDTLLALELVRDPKDGKSYAWVTTSDGPIDAHFRRFIPHHGGARLVKYTYHEDEEHPFGFLTFDGEADGSMEEFACLQEGLLQIVKPEHHREGEHSFFGGGPRYTIAVQDFTTIELDLIIVGFNGVHFFGAFLLADGTERLQLATQTVADLVENFAKGCESASWTPYVIVDFRAILEGFACPSEIGDGISAHLTVRDEKGTLRFCRLTVETSFGFAEDQWSVKPFILFDERLLDGEVVAWVRRADEELIVLPLAKFFTQ